MLAFVVLLLLFDFNTKTSPVLDSMLDVGHLPLFGVVSLVLVWVFNKREWPVCEYRYYIFSISAVMAFGIVTEFLQTLTPNRFFSISDILYDTLGALTFLTLAYPSSGAHERPFKRYKTLAFVVILLSTIPFYIAVYDSWKMHSSFPLLNSFETGLEMRRVSGKDNRYMQSQQHATHGDYALEFHLSPGEYPGIALEKLYGDWSGYSAFSFDAYLDGNKPLPITVRINDALHNQDYSDRFNKKYVLMPGANKITINLAEVMKAPRTRTMDMSRIANICVFSYRLKEPRTLFFDNFRLEKGSTQKR